jgi:hypothetical protein
MRLLDRLETSRLVISNLPPPVAREALERARDNAAAVAALCRAYQRRTRARKFVHGLCSLGRVARATGFAETVRALVELARTHRRIAVEAGLEVSHWLAYLRGELGQ